MMTVLESITILIVCVGDGWVCVGDGLVCVGDGWVARCGVHVRVCEQACVIMFRYVYR